MRILIAHNFYRRPGGEDHVFEAECALLKAHGHFVHEFVMHNDDLSGLGLPSMAGSTLWNRRAYRQLGRIVHDNGIEVAHFHNTFPLMSPSVYFAARSNGAAVVQTLHNYRLICPAATLFRDGKLCEKCIGRTPWPAVIHGCYRNSRPATAMTAAMIVAHRAAGTYVEAVDRYVALTEFARSRFVAGGLPDELITVKPNFVPGRPAVGGGSGGYAVYVGRLAMEKGIEMMLEAWRKLGGRVPLKIIGDGLLGSLAGRAADEIPGVQWLGRLPMEQVMEHLGEAAMLIFPSIWYEGHPRTIIESFAKGTPVVASRLGSMIEMIDDGRTGRFFEAGNPTDLARTVEELWQNPAQLAQMRAEARLEYEQKYTDQSNYRALMEVYTAALERYRPAGVPAAAPDGKIMSTGRMRTGEA